jgi:hypothetical protein
MQLRHGYKTLFFLFLLLLQVQVANAASKQEFSIFVAPSLNSDNMDIWYRTPHESAPFIHTVSSVTQGQPFQLLVFASGYSLDENKRADMSYDMQVYDPSGKPTEDHLADMEVYKGKVGNSSALLLSHQYPKIVFTRKYPLGTYTINVTAHDHIANKTLSISKTVTLEPFTLPKRFESDEAAAKWMMGYHRAQTPSKAIPAIFRAVHTDKKWLHRNLNILTFFRHILRHNPYLVRRIAEHASDFSQEDMKKILTVAAIMNPREVQPLVKPLKGDLLTYYQHARNIRIPSTDGEITTATQLDILWSEFLATGTYRPIQKIVSALALQKYRGTLDKIKAGELDKNDPEVRKHAYLDATYGSAVWSLISNCKQMDLVFQYCIYIYQNEPLDKEIKGQLYALLKIAQEKRKKASDEPSRPS